MGIFKPIEVRIKKLYTDGAWGASMIVAAWCEPSAAEFYNRLKREAYLPDHLVRVVPTHNVIYVMVPKAACTRIRATLGAIGGRYSWRLKPSQWGRVREAQGPRSMTVRSFYRLATSPATFRFSFVRNPYARLLSFWANHIQDKPLVRGSLDIDDYLSRREDIDRTLPAGQDKTLSFEQFLVFAAASANSRKNQHLQLQDDILSVPGITLDFVGRMESYNADINYVLDRMGANAEIRREALMPVNASRHGQWSEYYSPELADRVYRAYERDFDRFGYPRAC